MNFITDIFKTLWRATLSFFSLPAWVILWIAAFLIPANFIAFWFLDLPSGPWIAGLGAGSIIVNLVVIYINRGLSKVLALPHLLFWIPLVIYLWPRIVMGLAVSETEFWIMLGCAVVNSVSLIFDIKDGWEWWRGKRDVYGFEGEPVRL